MVLLDETDVEVEVKQVLEVEQILEFNSESAKLSVIVVFRGRNGKFAAAKSAPFRNLLQILLLFMKNLSFHHFKTEVVFFLSDKVPKVSIIPFFYFPIIVLKLPVCLKLLY